MEEILLKNCTFLTMDESNPRFFGMDLDEKREDCVDGNG